MAIRRPRHPARVAIVAVSAIIIVNLAIFAALAQVNGPAEKKRPTDIVLLTPNEGELTLPQGTVGAQVRTDFTAQLTIDGRLIPQDQLSGDPNLGEFFFDPAPGKEFGVLPKGHNSAIVEWWPKEIATPEAARRVQRLASYSWAFNVG